jgi:glutaminyl-peptide cyclotransferase
MSRFALVTVGTRQLATMLALVGLIAAGCARSGSSTSTDDQRPVERLTVNVITTYPHDRGAFTQGLELDDAEHYFESTGQYGRSTLRRVTLLTGEVVAAHALPPEVFAEGLTRVGDRLVQLTWRERTAYVYDATTFRVLDTFSYDTEGWGLCFDGTQLVMSDGSGTLYLRDPDTFELRDEIDVRLEGALVDKLNELECVDGTVYANVYRTDQILQIDPTTGHVVADIDASGLLPVEDAAGVDVLNGIAYDADRDVFLLTGKLWPTVFEVTFESTG